MILFQNSFLFQRKNRQENEDSQYRHDQTSNRPGCQREPEGFLPCTYHERDEPQDSRNHRQEDRNNLDIPCFHKGTDRFQFRETTTDIIVLVHDINAGIDRNPAQQHKRGKATLVEIQSKQIESQEYPNVRNWNHKDNGGCFLSGGLC